MDKKALQSFALFAKDSLETQIKVSLKLIGIHSDKDIKKAYIQGDFTIIDGDSKTYPSDLKVKRDHILELIKTDGYAYTIEQFAYTWFNRLIALRFMEVHDYLPHGFKVFPKGNGSIEPEILGKLILVEKELNLDIELCRKLKEKAQIEELYRYVLFQQCNALSGVLPMLFSKEYAYLELMLPSTLLKGTTVITELIKIDESNFLDDVEVIGWLYQFYVSSNREEFRKAKVVNKDLIPTLTQIFTPDWIVRYMTENSLGRLWLESYPDSSVKKEFKYYVEDAEQTEEVKKQIESIRYKNVDPKDIKVIEPCSGSGHILVYAFDVLVLMYEEKGYSKNDIPKLILDNNLFGLDVDKRASQLASFSLIMKARSIDSRFFQPNRISYPKVFEIKDSKMLISMEFKKKLLDLNNNDWEKDEQLSDDELKVVDYVIETFVDGKVIGSLLKVKRDNYVPLISKMNHLHKVTIRGIFNGEFVEYGLKRIIQLLRLAEIMSRKYDVMITNPPYIGSSKLDLNIKNYTNEFYHNSKDDMFAMFMETDFVKTNGFSTLVNPDSWMYLISYEQLRNSLNNNKMFINLVQHGLGAFDATVQTVSFVFRNTQSGNYISKFLNGKMFVKGKVEFNDINCYYRTKFDFSSLPSCQYAYDVSDGIIRAFKNGTKIGHLAKVITGITTGDNELYLRNWQELDYTKINFNVGNMDFINLIEKPWIPITRGGNARKWYGNNESVVNWGQHKLFHRDRSTNKSYYLKEGVTWGKITTGMFSARYFPKGYLWLDAGSAFFVKNESELKYILGFLSTKIAAFIMQLLNPTISCQVIDIQRVPIIIDTDKFIDIINLVDEAISISKTDWDSSEISFDFKTHPVFSNINQESFSLKEKFIIWQTESLDRFNRLREIEKQLNSLFISIYDLNKDFDSEVEDSSITVSVVNKKDGINSVVSYLIGILFGRYSLNQDGIVYAGGNNNIQLNSNNIGVVQVYRDLGMKESLTTKVIELIKNICGDSYYRENIDFIAESIGKKNNESPEETLNRYLFEDFYEYHLKQYSFRGLKYQIYWMLNSGKNEAFRCLFYLHKYTEDTLATINSQYLLPESTRLKYELNELNNQLVKADDKTRRILEKEKVVLENKYNEIIEYGQVLDHMANRYISIDLDDGVKVNYEKFQGIEIVTDSGTRIKKDLLVPIK